MSLRPEILNRYRKIVLLLARHVRSDILGGSAMFEFLEEEDRKSAEESETSAPEELANDLERLGPTFIKLGQLLSTRPDLLPPSYLEALSRLQDDVEPVPFEDIERTVTEELGVRPSKVFERFDSDPVGSASLAQVHRAVLRDGRDVVVKVQRPGIRQEVVLDLEALETIAGLTEKVSETARRYRFAGIVEEFRRVLLRELDYQREAVNLERMGRALEEFEGIDVPTPIGDFTTSRVLTMDYVDGTKIADLNPVVLTDLPGADLAEELFRAYLHQVLVQGTFHADPHPGNVLLTRDHRIALVDLGMIGTVEERHQELLVRMLLGASDGDGTQVVDIAARIAEPMDGADEVAFRKQVSEFVELHSGSNLEQLQLGHLLIEVTRIAASTGFLLPVSFSVLAKTLLNLDQIAAKLSPHFDPTASFNDYATELLESRWGKKMTKEKLLAGLLETKDLVEHLPARANRILETLAANELRIQVDAVDEERLTRSVEKVANRITVGLVLAALIIGASMLMRIDTPFKIFGYPGLAMVFFVLAAAGALAQVWAILRDGD